MNNELKIYVLCFILLIWACDTCFKVKVAERGENRRFEQCFEGTGKCFYMTDQGWEVEVK